jgi:hypothetical protein
MAVLAVPDEPTLLAWRDAVASAGIRARIFHEPDFGPLSGGPVGHHTALATEPISGGRRRVFAGLRPVKFRKGVTR